MLQTWSSVQDAVSAKPSHVQAQEETAEHRENRLRTVYERALALHQSGSPEAKPLFEQLASALSDSAPTSSSPEPPAKRQRLETPLWERRLHYVSLRNLGETHAAQSAHLPALRAYAHALDLDPSDFIVWVRAARSAAAAGHLHVARRAYESALLLRPRHKLALIPLHAVTSAIGDGDEDVGAQAPPADALVLAQARQLALTTESEPISEPEHIVLPDISWVVLVHALLTCLDVRLKGSGPLVAHPVFLDAPAPAPQRVNAQSESSDEVEVVAESRVTSKRPRESQTESVPPSAPRVETRHDAPRPEVRRSSRRAEAVADGERRRTRTFGDARDGMQVDANMIQTLLRMCVGGRPGALASRQDVQKPCLPEDNEKSATDVVRNEPMIVDDIETRRVSSWKRVIDEREEANAVLRSVKHFNNGNSGPADLLLRVLSVLSQLKVIQYFPTLALLWTTVREKLLLHTPGSPGVSALIVEAMIVSGKKAGKQKARRFQEASRLLSLIRVPAVEDDEGVYLHMRLTWLSGLLHECRGEMQLSYEAAERTRALLLSIKKSPRDTVPEIAGPDLSGHTAEALEVIVTNRIARLKSARDLEKAEEELSKVGDGDKKAAQRTVSILAPSVYTSVCSLQLDKWQASDLKFEFSDASELLEWETRYEAEIDLEPRVIVLYDACVKSSDPVGELVCFSIRLRMAVHYYAAKVRSESEKDAQAKDSDTSTARMADLLVQIRKYVALIKKLTSNNYSHLWTTEPGITGWSMADASAFASVTLVSLTELIITMIPLLKFSNGNFEMGAAQKNRRLGFTRCMLAFPRCIMLMHKCISGSHKDSSTLDSGLSRKMLQVISFCLRALVARGCCREEGTSGALIKLYSKYLCNRLQEVARFRHSEVVKGEITKEATPESASEKESNEARIRSPSELSDSPTEENSTESSGGNYTRRDDPDYDWTDVNVLRQELAQCFQCLYQVQELEPTPNESGSNENVSWLDEGCRVSKHLGLAFIGSEPSGAGSGMDVDVCRSVYFFYRKRIFEAVCLRRREGGRVKRLREVLSQLAESLPEDPSSGVRLLPFTALDTIVSDVVDTNGDISREAAENVSRLEEEWHRQVSNEDGSSENFQTMKAVQNSIMYFEVFSLHAMSILASHEVEYKKQKNAERRKRPKEVAERLLTASSDCLIALRSRPWSVGAWILLGRIFVEISDLALDERELCLSSFGLYRREELSSLGDGENVHTICGRAEACFAFAASLLLHPWAQKACGEKLSLSAPFLFGLAYDGSDVEPWFGFGDDGDLFESFGLTNNTTSRPMLLNEPHPGNTSHNSDTRRIGAIRLGNAALNFLRLREERYFHIHWTLCSLETKVLVHPSNRFNQSTVDLALTTLDELKQGVELCDIASTNNELSVADSNQKAETRTSHFSVDRLSWRSRYNALEKYRWYYSFLEAKLLRKTGSSHQEYLQVLKRALDESISLRNQLKQPRDIELLYKLHSSRMKILRTTEDNSEAISLLSLLERYSFKTRGPVLVEDARGMDKDVEDWVAERRIAVAEDIISAMQACSDSKADAQYTEFFFKSTYCKAVLLAEVLKDTRGALEELSKLFRIDAAAKVLDQRQDGFHRGYFYKLWNYRYTDTGIEPSLETERKLVRWRAKLLGLFGQLLRQVEEWRLLAAIIYRLKKRTPDDLPVDGAILDDLIEAYAVTCRATTLKSMEKGIISDVSAFESSYRRTWDIYVETLRLAQGAKKVRLVVMRGEKGATVAERLVESGRPRCVVAMHTALHLECVRWKSARDGVPVDIAAMRELPVCGKMRDVAIETRNAFVQTMLESVRKWPLDEKMMRLFTKRVNEYQPVASTPEVPSPAAPSHITAPSIV